MFLCTQVKRFSFVGLYILRTCFFFFIFIFTYWKNYRKNYRKNFEWTINVNSQLKIFSFTWWVHKNTYYYILPWIKKYMKCHITWNQFPLWSCSGLLMFLVQANLDILGIEYMHKASFSNKLYYLILVISKQWSIFWRAMLVQVSKPCLRRSSMLV